MDGIYSILVSERRYKRLIWVQSSVAEGGWIFFYQLFLMVNHSFTRPLLHLRRLSDSESESESESERRGEVR